MVLEFYYRAGRKYVREMLREAGVTLLERHRLREKSGVVKKGNRVTEIVISRSAARYSEWERIWKEHIDYQQGFYYVLAHDSRVPKPLPEEVWTYRPTMRGLRGRYLGGGRGEATAGRVSCAWR